jgi:hypothetical protein
MTEIALVDKDANYNRREVIPLIEIEISAPPTATFVAA